MEAKISSAKGLILKVESRTKDSDELDFLMQPEGMAVPEKFEEQNLEVRILSGAEKGKIVEIANDLQGNPYDVKVKAGDKVFLYAEQRVGQPTEYFVQDHWHLDGLMIWGAVFLVLVLIFGKKKGIKALLTLGLSLLLIFGVLIPQVQAGYSPVLVTLLIALAVTLITILILTGFTRKALTAILGTMGGVITATIFAYLVGFSTHLSGLGTEDGRILALHFPDLNFQGLLFSGMIIGALGAVMDVAISIASGLEEVKKHNHRITTKELASSGMAIGRDIFGSMLNTLIFAYAGASLALILLFSAFKTDLVELLNYGFISEEIVRSLVGSFGLLATIPLTAVIAGFLHSCAGSSVKD